MSAFWENLLSTSAARLGLKVKVIGQEDAAASLVPNGTKEDQRLTVDGTAGGVQFSAFDPQTTHVYLTVENAQCRVTFDGSAPTSTNGHILNPYYAAYWPVARAAAAKFIRTGSTSGVIHASEMKGA